MSRVNPERQALFDRARDPIRQAARKARWVLTQYPTLAYAQDAGMELGEYEEFVARRSISTAMIRPNRGASWGAGRLGWSST